LRFNLNKTPTPKTNGPPIPEKPAGGWEIRVTMSASSATDKVICHCLGVTETDIRSAIATGTVQTIKCIMTGTGAGTGCTACIRRLNALIGEGCAHSSPPSVVPAACVAK
jgi:bacterioferritin-associated ferredoxin